LEDPASFIIKNLGVEMLGEDAKELVEQVSLSPNLLILSHHSKSASLPVDVPVGMYRRNLRKRDDDSQNQNPQPVEIQSNPNDDLAKVLENMLNLPRDLFPHSVMMLFTTIAFSRCDPVTSVRYWIGIYIILVSLLSLFSDLYINYILGTNTAEHRELIFDLLGAAGFENRGNRDI
jgi:hypothetical protein